MADRPTIVVVGAASRDLHPADPRGWRLGGGVTYSSLAAARLGVEVRALVGVESEAAAAPELDVLREADVDIRLVHLERAPVFDNQQMPDGRVQIAHRASDHIPSSLLSADWRSPSAAILAPVGGELADEWASAFAHDTQVALAVQGVVRRLDEGHRVTNRPFRRGPLIARSQAILISAEDIAEGSEPVRELLQAGQELVVTHGPAGALWLNGELARYVPPFPPRDPVDSTGAGDTFLGAWVAARLLLGNAERWRALLVASAMASLSVRARTLADLPTAAELCQLLVRLRDRRFG